MTEPGWVVVLNGVPRSGKTSIARAIGERADDRWMNLGVDAMGDITPAGLRPGIGLRPGGERPDLEAYVVRAYGWLFATVAAVSRRGTNVVVDVGLHDHYSSPLGVVADAHRRLAGLPVVWVGVRCPLDVILARRDAGQEGRRYLGSEPDGSAPDPVRRWQAAVHRDMAYDLELDTSVDDPDRCAARVLEHLSRVARPPGHG